MEKIKLTKVKNWVGFECGKGYNYPGLPTDIIFNPYSEYYEGQLAIWDKDKCLKVFHAHTLRDIRRNTDKGGNIIDFVKEYLKKK